MPPAITICGFFAGGIISLPYKYVIYIIIYFVAIATKKPKNKFFKKIFQNKNNSY